MRTVSPVAITGPMDHGPNGAIDLDQLTDEQLAGLLSSLFKGVKKVVSKVAKVATKVAPIALTALPGLGPVAGTIVGAVGERMQRTGNGTYTYAAPAGTPTQLQPSNVVWVTGPNGVPVPVSRQALIQYQATKQTAPAAAGQPTATPAGWVYPVVIGGTLLLILLATRR